MAVIQLGQTDLAQHIRSCPQPSTLDGCPCRRIVKAPVPGEGPINARVVIIDRNPGREEDAQGRPFVGRSGQLLNTFLTALGLRRGDCAILNLVKCFTPDNREPFDMELTHCQPFLQSELQMLDNKRVIFLLGDTVVRTLLGRNPGRISEIEGQLFYDWKWKICLIPLTHPSYWSRCKEERIKVFQKIIPRLNGPLQNILLRFPDPE